MFLKWTLVDIFPGKGADWLVAGSGRNGVVLRKVGMERMRSLRSQKTGEVTKT